MGTNEDDKEKYDLYTEQVVLHPAKKYKWLIRIGKLLLFAVSVVIAATLFMVFLYPVLQKRIEEKNKDKNVIYIQKDNYILAENQTAEYSDILTEKDLKDNYEAAMAALRAKVEDVNKCVVSVDIEQPFSNVPTIESSQTEVAGLVVANVNSTYLVLTSSSLLEPGMNYIVRLSDEVQTEAAFVCRNTASGIGIVSINASKLTAEQRNSIAVAQLDNSYMVKQGDLVIASGKLYETSKGVSYGTIGRGELYNDDPRLGDARLCGTTASLCGIEKYGFEGNVVGVSKASTDTSSKFIGISDLKAQIETMINEHGIMYCGITGQNVTEELAAKYGLPSGVYISNVDIDSPAYYAGLQAGDVISAINGQSVLTIQQFSEKLYQCADGEAMYVTAMRQGKDGYSDVAFSVSVQLKQLN